MVAKEVPEFNFYEIKEEVGQYPYKDAPLSERLVHVQEKPIPKADYQYSKLENGYEASRFPLNSESVAYLETCLCPIHSSYVRDVNTFLS